MESTQPGNPNNAKEQLKLKIYAYLQGERASLERLLSVYRQALRAENIILSRAERRRLLKDILAEMIDESLL
jgi:hypothetical protein